MDCKHEKTHIELTKTENGNVFHTKCYQCGEILVEDIPGRSDFENKINLLLEDGDIINANRMIILRKAQTGENIDPEHLYKHFEVTDLLNHYVCSGCWHRLATVELEPEIVDMVIDDPARNNYVYCPQCLDVHGFVTASYVAIKKDKSHNDYFKARQNLRGLICDEELKKVENSGVDQLLQMLGFR